MSAAVWAAKREIVDHQAPGWLQVQKRYFQVVHLTYSQGIKILQILSFFKTLKVWGVKLLFLVWKLCKRLQGKNCVAFE